MTSHQPQNGPHQESFQTQANTKSASHTTFAKGSKLFTFKEAMMLSMRDYKIIFCIALVLLILGILRIHYLPGFFLGLLFGGIYGGGSSFFEYILFLPIFLWGMSVIFLPVVLILHYTLNRRLKNMLEKLERKASQQQYKPSTAQTK
ncbi:hypothetical protein [Bartonella florencae]|uniref:hypothetical protein n=1 Tax=Bartonella florencae TaxID=928210 RepID=UPI0002ED34D9|nr:hypothetical protein [Bartonella florencae]